MDKFGLPGKSFLLHEYQPCGEFPGSCACVSKSLCPSPESPMQGAENHGDICLQNFPKYLNPATALASRFGDFATEPQNFSIRAVALLSWPGTRVREVADSTFHRTQ